MKNKPGASALTTSLCRGKVDVDVPKPKTDYFPPNVRKLLPTSYYTQFKARYYHFTIPPEKCMSKEKEWFESFPFDTRIRENYT